MTPAFIPPSGFASRIVPPMSNFKSATRQNGNENKRPPPPSSMAIEKKRRISSSRSIAREVASETNAVHDIEDFSPHEALRIRSSLLGWYDKNRRDLPWRTPTTPSVASTVLEEVEERRAYAVWVSEVMLQQTRVPVVVGYYNRWMEKWPTIRDLSAATLEEVNELWAGLGYYRRARFLLEGSKAIVNEGKFPRTASALRGVRGIGNYTAGAIASIAFNEVVPVVDGNVVRVITRLKAISANPKEAGTVKLIWKLASQLVDLSRPGDFNQAIMELGATLCSLTSPRCSECPVSDQCQALTLSRKSTKIKVVDYPAKVAKTKQRNDFAAVCVVEIAQEFDEDVISEDGHKHGFLLVKRPENGLLAGLWEFPSVLLNEESMNQRMRRVEMDKYLQRLFNIDIGRNCKVIRRHDVGEYVHVFSHIRLQMHVELLVLVLKGNFAQFSTDEEDHCTITWKCVDENSIKSMGLTSGVRKVYHMVQKFKEKQPMQISKRIPRKKARRST
ncbi:hypothetical protein HPP92_026192 [Vanilla planifolia]|uniref:Adenine DNA glycosylase n=1 Tax=Vanilla planifolia TaxID=51239 RepID=A0A835RCX7_VANPL|nr:hypothetical protein HPP92_026192 [Vanilla planifolia]KAG0488779.1 hypothetical protein HPP92_007590 [Vanilla planifolia]